MNRPPEPPLLKYKKPVPIKPDKHLGYALFCPHCKTFQYFGCGRNMCTCFAEGDFVIEDGSVVHGKYPVIIQFPFSEYEYRCNFKVVAWR